MTGSRTGERQAHASLPSPSLTLHFPSLALPLPTQVEYDVLDVDDPRFADDFAQFRRVVQDLERRLASCIMQARRLSPRAEPAGGEQAAAGPQAALLSAHSTPALTVDTPHPTRCPCLAGL